MKPRPPRAALLLARRYDECVWCTQGAPQAWLAEVDGLQLDAAGFIEVDSTLQSPTLRGVFAAGDVASFIGAPRPKARKRRAERKPPPPPSPPPRHPPAVITPH